MIATVGKLFFFGGLEGGWNKMCVCVTWLRSGRRVKCRFIVEAVTIGEPENAAIRRRRPLTQHIIHMCKTKSRVQFTLKLNEKKNYFSGTFYITFWVLTGTRMSKIYVGSAPLSKFNILKYDMIYRFSVSVWFLTICCFITAFSSILKLVFDFFMATKTIGRV